MGDLQPKENGGWQIKNSVGHILSQVSAPNYERYIVMTQVLNNKILAFNAVNQEYRSMAELNDPAEGRRYFEKAGKLCIEPPYPKEKIAGLQLKTDSCVDI